MSSIAWFITPHGYGHASRACAVMEALQKLAPQTSIHIYTTVPEWFFQDSLGSGFTYHQLVTDIGIVQRGPFDEDFHETLRKLAGFLPFSETNYTGVIRELAENQVKLVVCDIAPLGIELARRAGIPSMLIENFTWSWIYSGYAGQYPDLTPFIDYLRGVEAQASYHYQTEPICSRIPDLPLFPPASRQPRRSRSEVREDLGVAGSDLCVLVSTGGIPLSPETWRNVHFPTDIRLIIPGGAEKRTQAGSAIFLPHHSDFYHPDLLYACDAVVGKVGYSTLAETYQAGLPFGFISRPGFPESPVLAGFVCERMPGLEIGLESFISGSWVNHLEKLLQLPHRDPPAENGAFEMAARIQALL